MRLQTDGDRKMTQLMWIVGIAFGAMLGIGGTVTLSYGATRQQTEENTKDILYLQRRSVDFIYVQDLIESNQKLISILQSTPGTPEYKRALQEWSDFQDKTMRRANPTRSVSSSKSDSGASNTN